MTMLYPLTFQAIFKDRIWGGRQLESLYQKQIPEGKLIGEAWEITDRPGDTSVIANGLLAGKDIRWLMQHHSQELLGEAAATPEGRFPLLCKILDAREKLSLQVHPPASKAKELKGEPKTEMWYIADSAKDACLYVGLKSGVTRSEFEKKIANGTVAECFHRIPVKAGDTMFLPSGRVHAIGDGLVIFEIQQNSDTTYRVFDWNRVGLDGKPRELHVDESLSSIDFNDFEPRLVPENFRDANGFKFRLLVEDPLFTVQELRFDKRGGFTFAGQVLRILAVIGGKLFVSDPASGEAVSLKAGQFVLLPACLTDVRIEAEKDTTFLCVEK